MFAEFGNVPVFKHQVHLKMYSYVRGYSMCHYKTLLVRAVVQVVYDTWPKVYKKDIKM